MHVRACISAVMADQLPLQPKAEVLKQFSEVYDVRLFKVLSEPVRIRILEFLMLNGRSDIGSIADNMEQDRSVISRHLNQMQAVGILSCEKETRHKYYTINAKTFVDKLEGFVTQIKKSISVCCPPDCYPK
jgi:DNA-binding transcriptional ArsR family regulator